MNCALIGTTKIASIHVREMINNGIKEITIISRSKKKAKRFINNLNFQDIVFIPEKISILKKKKFDFINICSATKVHLKHLKYLGQSNSIVIVEKPIFSILDHKKNFIDILDKIYSKNKKIYICYPMSFLAKTFIKLSKNKNIKKIGINYYTTGNKKYKDIAIDLIPHTVVFLYFLIKKKINFTLKKSNIKKIKIEKSKWFAKLEINKIIIYIKLIENNKKIKSIFSFKVNKIIIKRDTKFENGNFQNYLNYKKQSYKIKNPMTEMFQSIFKNASNNNFFTNNKKLTYKLMKDSRYLV
ncbi:MAG: hypothetical protein CMA12_08065 [Euryarchaeota archaeon]|nr:hypothetical protein [Euryarchaeota archaeon]